MVKKRMNSCGSKQIKPMNGTAFGSCVVWKPAGYMSGLSFQMSPGVGFVSEAGSGTATYPAVGDSVLISPSVPVRAFGRTDGQNLKQWTDGLAQTQLDGRRTAVPGYFLIQLIKRNKLMSFTIYGTS